MTSVTGVSAADETPVPGPGRARGPLQGDRASTGRFGDRLFGGTSTAAGITVIAIVSLIAVFLVVQAVPAVLADQASFFTSREWAPGGEQPRFGIVEFLWTTSVSSTIAMFVAVPVGVAVALFLTQYAPMWMRRPAAALVDLLAAVPSIVYGLWGLITFGPFVKPIETFLQDRLGWLPVLAPTGISGGTIFFIGIVLAIMVLPIVTALSREVFDQTPVAHKEGALALGATRWEMIRTAVLPFGRPGVISAAMLALGRALGETIAVTFLVSALPDGAKWTWSLFNGGETFASKIANNAAEFSNPSKTGAYIAAGLVLFVLTFVVNSAARVVIERRKAFTE
ncbi:MAG TPA: phosphate ABC transporter permease subunit PstC [Intrasporangium sp.]|uniref:phosphate ABC transporter permease subunit PstC n=1 Tax=Intrasporangium sp. TaxID=1925024 RepID=UPI002D776C14|nr:phosphate ABC transporter permease subunit PstC [Intrasporangium sp.]HET7396934.1 phosphate ABC transporter permease subunit PstC [Intrasporangium sp.]